MNRYSSIRQNAAVHLVFSCLILAGCSSAVQVRLPENMVPFRDAAKKLEFQLPPGWEPAPVDPVIETSTSWIRWAAPAGFRKGDRGMLAVWCDRYDSNRSDTLHMDDVLRTYAPIFEGAGIYFYVDSPGSGYISQPRVFGVKATHVVKGEKKKFLIVTVIKNPPAVKMHRECTYMLFGRSASDEFSEEIKADITAIAATLRNSGE